jgi:hypothetical protein
MDARSRLLLASLLMLALVEMASAQATFYVKCRVFNSFASCNAGSPYLSILRSDLDEVRDGVGNNSITSAYCQRQRGGEYQVRECNSTSGVERFSHYSNSGCSGSPTSVVTFTIGMSICSHNPPLMYMGCVPDSNEASAKGFLLVTNTGAQIVPSIVSNPCIIHILLSMFLLALRTIKYL